ncbi:MAG: mechanosensitive ion channel family protein [Candidatus Latescibacterota bacterium]
MAVLEIIGTLLTKFVGPEAPFRGPILSGLTIVVLIITYWVTRRALKSYMKHRAYNEVNVLNFLAMYRYVFIFITVVFGAIALSGSMKTLGISAGFLGMMLGWSLQAPVTGIAAWLMIILKRPFKLGDRVIIAGIIGEVTDITLTHIILNQVGGTISGEEKSGRGVLIPNATMFGQIIYNYTLETKYILDEVPVRVTFDSDWDTVERILMDAARQVVGDIIEDTDQEPFIRSEFFDAGVLIRLRYQSIPAERQRMSSDITKIIFLEFAKTDKVRFCYPHSEIIYEWKEGPTLPPPAYGLPYPEERIKGTPA